ncbi:HEAT repeat domain-containing protein [Streptomyces sp. NPDC050145]|uniref:HEAT repeat domain-containing protein n=1 Tax=Streptomyces sp. NPDC050145 TaxID=3365602 RepID=UPI0037BDC66B
MINDLDGVDWASMSHAYGPAVEVPDWLRAMVSPDPEVREKAFSDFSGAAHHQGDVYDCTTRSLPFLLEMAEDPATPDRGAVLELVLSIGREACDQGEDEWLIIDADGEEVASTAGRDGITLLREHIATLASYASDPDPRIRRAGVEAIGLFMDDADRAVRLLRERLSAETASVERLLVIRTAADLALRLPAAHAGVIAWLGGLAEASATDPDIRLAALVHRARCAPSDLDAAVGTAARLLGRIAGAAESGRAAPAACACAADGAAEERDGEADGVPPQITAAFADMERHNRLHAPTTTLLRTFHQVLDERLAARKELLTAQLTSAHPAIRHDAIRMARDLITARRGDHSPLVLLLAGCLLPDDCYTSAAAGESLGALAVVAEPAREALAAYVAALVTAHGPDVWATPKSLLRRAYQEAVMALAHLGDVRALPALLVGLDSGIDTWRAVQVAGQLRSAADELTPRLSRLLAEADLTDQGADMSVRALISALSHLGDPRAVPVLVDAVTTAVEHGQGRTAASALKALASFGPQAAAALPVIRPLADAADVKVRAAATAAVWDLEGDPAHAVPRLQALLDTPCRHEAAYVLGRIGPPAYAALPQLREMTAASYEWTRVHGAAALWDIAGDAEVDLVLRTLLAAWEVNDATSNHVLDCLDRMGPAAAPALPRIEAELALSRRSGRFAGLSDDEDLQRVCRAVLARLA